MTAKATHTDPTPPEEFVAFADDFSKKYKELSPGTYQSDSGEYKLEYKLASNYGSSGFAKVSSKGELSLNKDKLCASEKISADVVFALIIWCWFRERVVFGIETDAEVIRFFKSINRPAQEYVKGFLYMLSTAPSVRNMERMEQFKKKFYKPEKE